MQRPGLAGLLVAVALVMASCGGGAGAGGDPSGGPEEAQNGDRGSMGHGGMSNGTGSDGPMGGEEMARRMLTDQSGDYSDKLFIDMMVPHHEGAVDMARVALDNSERGEIIELSRDIVRTQRAEIEQLGDIRRDVFGSSRVPMRMGIRGMRDMGVMNPRQLAQAEPFDKAFVDAMIPHHQSAIDMANVVLDESKDRRLRNLAGNIVEAQEREIAQMREWRAKWYPQG